MKLYKNIRITRLQMKEIWKYYKQHKVLIVEDESTNQILMTAIIKKRGYNIVFVENWQEVLE